MCFGGRWLVGVDRPTHGPSQKRRPALALVLEIFEPGSFELPFFHTHSLPYPARGTARHAWRHMEVDRLNELNDGAVGDKQTRRARARARDRNRQRHGGPSGAAEDLKMPCHDFLQLLNHWRLGLSGL